MKRFWVRKICGIVVMVLLITTVVSGIVMLLWNALMPSLFHLSVITWPQALGLLVLCKILFGGFRGGPRHNWKNKMRQHWMKMSPEEKEKFRQEWSRRCGGRGPFRGPVGGPFEKDPFTSGGPFSDEKIPPTESAS
ncbi:MAG TPA: hypothetical protein VGM31_09005 [Puia sp.]|jgi:hypothetical protein